jgi:hypothetical protein
MKPCESRGRNPAEAVRHYSRVICRDVVRRLERGRVSGVVRLVNVAGQLDELQHGSVWTVAEQKADARFLSKSDFLISQGNSEFPDIPSKATPNAAIRSVGASGGTAKELPTSTSEAPFSGDRRPATGAQERGR